MSLHMIGIKPHPFLKDAHLVCFTNTNRSTVVHIILDSFMMWKFKQKDWFMTKTGAGRWVVRAKTGE